MKNSRGPYSFRECLWDTSTILNEYGEAFVYCPINKSAAKRAKEMNSFSDCKPGSATEEYRRSVDEAAAPAWAASAPIILWLWPSWKAN